MTECIKNLLMVYGAYHVLKGTCLFIKDVFYPDSNNNTFIVYDTKTGRRKKVNVTSRKKKDTGKVIDIRDYK